MSEHGANCRVYWGSHGCRFERGHDGPHSLKKITDEMVERGAQAQADTEEA